MKLGKEKRKYVGVSAHVYTKHIAFRISQVVFLTVQNQDLYQSGFWIRETWKVSKDRCLKWG